MTRWAAALFSLTAAVTVGAQPVRVTQTVLLPPAFYVGDQVELRVDLETPTGLQLASPVPPSSPIDDAPAWLLIRAVTATRIDETLWQVRIRFTAYRPGVVTLPPIDLGGHVLTGLKVQTRSLLDDTGESDLRPAKTQLYLPGSLTRLILIGAFVAIAPVLILKFGRFLWLWTGRLRERRRRALPRLKFERGVRRLTGQADGDVHRFLFVLSDLTREYLTARFRIPAKASTTSELRASPVLMEPPGDQLAALLDAADQRRFGRDTPDDPGLPEITRRAVTVVRDLEEHYRVDP